MTWLTSPQSTELEPKGTKELTPEKMAAYYRAVGGNYDNLFLKTPHSSLSFIYQQLGCFHTLQNTENAFEAPSIPALRPCGFVRWQTIQILLSPDQNFGYLQEALQRYDIPPSGSVTFPKVLPREAFPTSPDKEMVKWHDSVGERMAREATTWRLKASPHQSPFDRPSGLHRVNSNDDHMENSDYFSRSTARPNANRPSRPHRANSQEAAYAQGRRRSVQEDYISPTTRPDPAQSPWPQYQAPRRAPSPRREPSSRHQHSSSRGQSPPQSDSSGSDASSEADSPARPRKTPTWSHTHLFPPHIEVHHARRHSHDATYTQFSTPPARPRDRNQQTTYKHSSPPSSYTPQPRHSNVTGATRGVQFRDSFADRDLNEHRDLSDPGVASKPNAQSSRQKGGPVQGPGAPPISRRWVKSADPLEVNTSVQSDRERDHTRNSARQFGSPARVNTVTGVGGRRYPPSAGSKAPEGWR
jgi:hypothetical protein